MGADYKIAVMAGEPSGDQLGAWLMDALREKGAQEGKTIHFIGIGGTMMQQRGLNSLIPVRDLAINGLTEIVRHIPKLKRMIRQTVVFLKAEQPDLIISIDAPGFCNRVTKQLKGQGAPLVHYVAPTVWAWKAKRAKKIAAFLDHLLVLLPFEPPYFEKEGLATTFVGHPVLRRAESGNAARFFANSGLPPDKPVLLVLPGSRVSEVQRMLPVYLEALTLIGPGILSAYQLAVPTVETVSALVRAAFEAAGIKAAFVEGDENRWDAFTAAQMALATSGTVSVELAAAQTPVVVGYKASALTAFMIRRMVRVRFAGLVNLLAGEMIQPELLYGDCTPGAVADAMRPLLEDEKRRFDQLKRVQTQLKKMQPPSTGGDDPEKNDSSAVAAGVIWDLLHRRKNNPAQN